MSRVNESPAGTGRGGGATSHESPAGTGRGGGATSRRLYPNEKKLSTWNAGHRPSLEEAVNTRDVGEQPPDCKYPRLGLDRSVDYDRLPLLGYNPIDGREAHCNGLQESHEEIRSQLEEGHNGYYNYQGSQQQQQQQLHKQRPQRPPLLRTPQPMNIIRSSVRPSSPSKDERQTSVLTSDNTSFVQGLNPYTLSPILP